MRTPTSSRTYDPVLTKNRIKPNFFALAFRFSKVYHPYLLFLSGILNTRGSRGKIYHVVRPPPALSQDPGGRPPTGPRILGHGRDGHRCRDPTAAPAEAPIR